jgi:hypothetical protein
VGRDVAKLFFTKETAFAPALETVLGEGHSLEQVAALASDTR